MVGLELGFIVLFYSLLRKLFLRGIQLISLSSRRPYEINELKKKKSLETLDQHYGASDCS